VLIRANASPLWFAELTDGRRYWGRRYWGRTTDPSSIKSFLGHQYIDGHDAF